MPLDLPPIAATSENRARALAAVLTTDLVDSTRHVVRLGNTAWRALIERHDRELREAVEAFGGRVCRTTGDGGLCLFPDAAQSIRCALRLHARLIDDGLKLRAAVHMGEIELREGSEIAGIAIHVCARLLDRAAPGETLVTDVVRGALLGSQFAFDPRGRRALRGLPSRWKIYAVMANVAAAERLRTARRQRRALTFGVACLALVSLGWAIPRVDTPALLARIGLAHEPASIAVLPFADLSGSPADGYFAVGIQDEILTQLARIGSLRVTSRTSTLRYQSQPDNLREIGRQLRVSHVLEGSVQMVGEDVRINVQLIDTRDDSHVWAEVYDRRRDDILGVQTEVARAVARALHAELSDQDRRALEQRTTQKPEAYDAYLRGLAMFTRGAWGEVNLREAIASFEQATKLDREFVQAWSQLSIAAAWHYASFERSPLVAALAGRALEQSMILAPEAPETLTAQAYHRYLVSSDQDAARVLFERLDREQPGSSEVKYALANVAQDQARWDDALSLLAQAVGLDPQNRELLWDQAFLTSALRRFDEALRLIDRALQTHADSASLIALKASVLISQGRLAAAQAVLDAAPADAPAQDLAWARVVLLGLQRKPLEQQALLREMLEGLPPDADFERISMLAMLGQVQKSAGESRAGRATLQQARMLAEPIVREQPHGSRTELVLAVIDAALGNHDEALAHLEHIEAFFRSDGALSSAWYDEHRAAVEMMIGRPEAAVARLSALLRAPNDSTITLTPELLRLDPTWDALRGRPDFEALLQSTSSSSMPPTTIVDAS